MITWVALAGVAMFSGIIGGCIGVFVTFLIFWPEIKRPQL